MPVVIGHPMLAKCFFAGAVRISLTVVTFLQAPASWARPPTSAPGWRPYLSPSAGSFCQ